MSEVMFRNVHYTVKKLVEDIHVGEIALPHIQRPFVWPNTKVRDLFDSMYRGFPIGYILLWENDPSIRHRRIGTDQKQKFPRLLIIDGQQRLTSLYAVLKGKKVVRENHAEEHIRIAFHPLQEKFEVTNSAIQQDPEWVPDITVLWKPETSTYMFIQEFLDRLKGRRPLSPEEERRIAMAIDRLVGLQGYPISALEIPHSVAEDQVAEIFVRINSKGSALDHGDFILTLMSVFWDEGREKLEAFSRGARIPPVDKGPSPYNRFLHPSPEGLLRVSVALGFRRAYMKHAYSLLRGKDLQTGAFSEEQRERQFAILRESQAHVLDLQNWHDFLTVLRRAGFVHPQLISSQTAALYAYALWLIGKRDFRVEPQRLRDAIARWFFMATLTGRYTGSESRMEQDLALLQGARNAEEFVELLHEQIASTLPKDYWEVTLPGELNSSAPMGTGQLVFYAAQCILGAPVLYSNMKVSQLLEGSSRGKRPALERHHLFPRRYLQRQGIRERRLINQAANYALMEWNDNAWVADRPPAEYAPKLEARFKPEEVANMYRLHALPEGWYHLDYEVFLQERRKRMAQIIREGFEAI